MDIEDLVGERELSGIDRWTEMAKGEDCEVCLIALDGTTYEFREDPDDGYRSYHEGPDVSETAIKNTFAPVPVRCAMREGGDRNEILVVSHRETGAVILEIGTDNTEDYYPWWVCNFSAEALGKL